MKTVLAIETSTAACSVALLHGDACYALFEMQPQKHAVRVLPMVDEVLAQAGIRPAQIDLLAFGEGPGAFTGLRIAAGVVQGLALGWDKPVQGVSSLEAVAYAGLSTRQVEGGASKIEWLALLDARMGEIYWQQGVYDTSAKDWQADAPQLLNTAQVVMQLDGLALERLAAFGDIDQAYPDVTNRLTRWQHALPSAEAVAKLARIKHLTGRMLSDTVPLPVYLRNQVADTLEQRREKALQHSQQAGV